MQILKVIVMGATLVITRYVIPYLKAKTDAEKMEKAMKYIREGVHAAEQIYDQKDSKIKKAYVMKFSKKLIGKMGFDLTRDELELLIEAAVRTMNNEDYLTVIPEDYEHIVQEALDENGK